MTYFKLSSWKLSTWLPRGCERWGQLRQRAVPRRAVPCRLLPGKTHLAFQEPARLGMPQVANQGGCFKPATDLLATAQTSQPLARSTRSG